MVLLFQFHNAIHTAVWNTITSFKHIACIKWKIENNAPHMEFAPVCLNKVNAHIEWAQTVFQSLFLLFFLEIRVDSLYACVRHSIHFEWSRAYKCSLISFVEFVFIFQLHVHNITVFFLQWNILISRMFLFVKRKINLYYLHISEFFVCSVIDYFVLDCWYFHRLLWLNFVIFSRSWLFFFDFDGKVFCCCCCCGFCCSIHRKNINQAMKLLEMRKKIITYEGIYLEIPFKQRNHINQMIEAFAENRIFCLFLDNPKCYLDGHMNNWNSIVSLIRGSFCLCPQIYQTMGKQLIKVVFFFKNQWLSNTICIFVAIKFQSEGESIFCLKKSNKKQAIFVLKTPVAICTKATKIDYGKTIWIANFNRSDGFFCIGFGWAPSVVRMRKILIISVDRNQSIRAKHFLTKSF